MIGLTEKQRSIMEFIESFMEKAGMAPTVYEIADQFEIKTSTVFAHLKALQRKKFLDRSSKARSISVSTSVRKKPKHLSFALPIPLLGRINIGLPVESIEHKEGEVYFTPTHLHRADFEHIYALKVEGESMRDAGILENDIIICKYKEHDRIRAGEIVIALINNETTVKYYYPVNDGELELRPANSEFKTQIYKSQNVQVQGVVIGLQRSY